LPEASSSMRSLGEFGIAVGKKQRLVALVGCSRFHAS